MLIQWTSIDHFDSHSLAGMEKNGFLGLGVTLEDKVSYLYARAQWRAPLSFWCEFIYMSLPFSSSPFLFSFKSLSLVASSHSTPSQVLLAFLSFMIQDGNIISLKYLSVSSQFFNWFQWSCWKFSDNWLGSEMKNQWTPVKHSWRW